jgi:hypothetical protein
VVAPCYSHVVSFFRRRRARRPTESVSSGEQVKSYPNKYSTRPESEEAPAGVIFARPAAEQPSTVPHELVEYLGESRVSSEVMDAVREG